MTENEYMQTIPSENFNDTLKEIALQPGNRARLWYCAQDNALEEFNDDAWEACVLAGRESGEISERGKR